MVKLKGYLNTKTINVVATEKRQIKIVVFLSLGCVVYDAYFVTNYVIWRHNDVICDEIRVICRIQKTAILISCSFVFSPLRIHSLFLRLNTPKVWPYMVMWREIWISLIACNFTQFFPIERWFSLLVLFFCKKNTCNVLNTAFQIFKNRCHLWRHTFK